MTLFLLLQFHAFNIQLLSSSASEIFRLTFLTGAQGLALWFQGAPGGQFLNNIVTFITGPFGKAVSIIAIVFCGCSYMYSKQSDNSGIGRAAVGVFIIVAAANIFAWIASALN